MMRKILLGLFLLLAAGAALAQPYVHLGPARLQADTGAGTSGAASAPYLAAGYRFTQHLAIEASYINTGIIRGAGDSRKIDGPGLAAIGTLPLGGGFSLIGKVGAYRLTSEAGVATGAVLGSGPPPAKTNLGTRPSLGAGVQYQVNRNLQLRALIEHIEGAGDLDRLRVVTAGAVLAFP